MCVCVCVFRTDHWGLDNLLERSSLEKIDSPLTQWPLVVHNSSSRGVALGNFPIRVGISTGVSTQLGLI